MKNDAAIVYLVGAGPGDPGLLTVAGRDALVRADVLVYDYLANPRLIELAPEACEKIYVGKSAGQHTLTQEGINQLLIDKAKGKGERGEGKGTWTVVRLKGGDPYVFGRGGEEGEALRAAGVHFVEIPGITSGIAAPAYAGIPVTHRDFATTLTLVTGHEKEEGKGDVKGEEDPRVNFAALAQLAKNGTLCFYMGVKALPSIVGNLMKGGLDPAMPVAVIRWGTHPHQQTVTGTLATIVDVVREAGITAPAMTIVGKVVTLRATLNWFEKRPLFGQTVLVTRTRQQASELTAQLSALGAHVLEAPTIELAEPENFDEVDACLDNLGGFNWVVFTSANGVRVAWERIRLLGKDARVFFGLRVGAIGPSTAEALEKIGIVADLIPEKFVGEELAASLKQTVGEEHLRGARFLLLRADIARPVLREQLEAAGAEVHDLAIYRTVMPRALPDDVLAALHEEKVDWVTFTSASTAQHLHDLLPTDLREKVGKIHKLSIGPVTTAALTKLGWAPKLEAARHDIPGMIEALERMAGQK
jgi:uroporphyrinogen III methyltransferase / synthase